MSQRKLLLADDSITIQKVVNLTFADEGIEVVTVGDGDAAMEKMSDFKPDLILADVNMPGLNGYQICEKIKQSDEFGQTPVILLVGSFEPFDESEAKRVGADDFLTKPFQSIRQLVTKVTELLGSNGAASDQPAEVNTKNTVAVADENSPAVENSVTKFGAAEADDEMIQTNQPTGFGFDEVGKFETKENPDFTEDAAKTQPLSPEDIKQVSFSSPAHAEENVESSNEISSSAQNVNSETISTTETKLAAQNFAPDGDFDDDFLELPPDEFDEAEDPQSVPVVGQQAQPVETETAQSAPSISEANFEQPGNLPEREGIPTNDNQSYSSVDTAGEQNTVNDLPAQNQSQPATFTASNELSSETIDVIVQRVVEKLSDQVVREIAWEVVPQMTDLIVKKMAEEKLKE